MLEKTEGKRENFTDKQNNLQVGFLLPDGKNTTSPKEAVSESSVRPSGINITNLTRTEKCSIYQIAQVKASNIAENIFRRIFHQYNLIVSYQHIISPYIVDFYISSKGLIVEIDGGVHNEKFAEIKDAHRESYLFSFGIKVIRYNITQPQESPEQFISNIIDNFPTISKTRKRLLNHRISRTNTILGNPRFILDKIKTFQQVTIKYNRYQKSNKYASELRRRIKKLGEIEGRKKYFKEKNKHLDKIMTYRLPAINSLSIKINEYGAITN